MSLAEKISQIQPTHKTHQRILDRYQKESKVVEILLDIKDHAGMKMITEQICEAVNHINSKLLSGETLTEIEREKLLTDRERCEWFLNIFPNQEIIKERIEKFIESYNKK